MPERRGTAATSATLAAVLAQTRSGQDPADCPLTHPMPQPGQLALNAPVPPVGFSLASCSTSARASPGTGGRPAAFG